MHNQPLCLIGKGNELLTIIGEFDCKNIESDQLERIVFAYLAMCS